MQVRGALVPISAVCGRLWNCTDTLPAYYREELDGAGIRAGSYVSAARQIRRFLKP